MAKKEENTNKKGLSKGWKLAIVGFAILAAGVLAFGGAFALGLITLARDLAATAIVLEGAYVGGIAANGLINAISNKKNANKDNVRTQQRTRNRELERENELTQQEELEEEEELVEENTMESIPVKEEVLYDGDDIAIVSTKKNNSTRKR